MKSKEEILDENDVSFNDLEESESSEKQIHKAMDIFAKETAIGFAKWLLKNYWLMGDNELMETGSNKRYTIEELYELYIKSEK